MRQRIRKGVLTFSLLLFPLTFFFLSPYIIIASASSGIINGSAVIFGLLLLFSIVGSRLFCGWLCPGGVFQDQIAYSNGKSWNGKWRNLSKYVIWAVWLAFIIYLWISHRPLNVNFFNMFDINPGLIISYFMVVILIFIFTLLTGKRSMCHSLCWMAPFMVIGEKVADLLHIPRFRLVADSNVCINCRQCDKQCLMGLKVSEMVKANNMDSTECITCLECVDACPRKAISCGVKRKQKHSPSHKSDHSNRLNDSGIML